MLRQSTLRTGAVHLFLPKVTFLLLASYDATGVTLNAEMKVET
jgi:hypothetical protein